MRLKLTPEFVEFIHDVLVAVFLPFDEVVGASDYRDKNLIGSALDRPFQTAFGEEVYPEVSQKAAALFHSLTCNHCFLNGNKRTAVLATEFFLQANGYILLMPQNELYGLAKTTASANERGLHLQDLMASLSSHFAATVLPVGQSIAGRNELIAPYALKIIALSAGIISIPKLYGIEIAELVP